MLLSDCEQHNTRGNWLVNVNHMHELRARGLHCAQSTDGHIVMVVLVECQLLICALCLQLSYFHNLHQCLSVGLINYILQG